MPVSGLVISLTDQPSVREEAITAIGQETRIEIGVIQSGRMAIVMDTLSSEEDKRLWDWLSSIPGVEFVDVAMIGFEAQGETAVGGSGTASTLLPSTPVPPAEG